METQNIDQEYEIQALKLENEQLKDKVKELESWLVMLLNNFYDGNSS